MTLQPEPLLSVAEAARRVGVSRQALHKQVQRGQVRAHRQWNGRPLVKLSEVRRDRASNLQHVNVKVGTTYPVDEPTL